jgi:outer membrane protein
MRWEPGAIPGRRCVWRGIKTLSAIRTALLATAALAAVGVAAGRAETIGGALTKAYLNNPDINQERAAVRASDENVPKANAGYLPTIEAQGNIGLERANASVTRANGSSGGSTTVNLRPRGYGVSATQTVWNGNRTINSIRQAESGVLGAREQLRNTEQNTLLDGVTAYMDVLRDTAILELDRNNVQVLQEQLRETRDRFTVGEVTRTDVAQAEASLSTAQATALSAEATLESSIARYHQVIGDQPAGLAPVKPILKPLPWIIS